MLKTIQRVSKSLQSTHLRRFSAACLQKNESNLPYVESKEDFRFVERLLPPSRIPNPPKHDSYPTPTGWFPPADTIPDLPYHVSRDRYHQFPVEVIEDDFNKDDTPIDINKIAQLEEKKMLTAVTNIRGDLWELAQDLEEAIRPHSEFDPVTSVDEDDCVVYIKGDFHKQVTEFLGKTGF